MHPKKKQKLKHQYYEAIFYDIMGRFKENALLFQEAANEKTKNTEKDLAQGKEMRRQSLETFSETLKRKSTEDDSPTNSKRSRNTVKLFVF